MEPRSSQRRPFCFAKTPHFRCIIKYIYVIMTEYVLDIETYQQSDDYSVHGCPSFTKYFFQIDINGNVNISEKTSCKSDGAGEKKKILSINDNIPVPQYFINIIKALIIQQSLEKLDNYKINNFNDYNIIHLSAVKSDRGIYDHVFKKYWEMVIDVIKRMKLEIKELVENPQDNLDIKTQLDTFISKINLQQENIVELEKKIKNIQTAYFDSLNDNKKLKEIIKEKDNKQREPQCENKRLLQEINAMKQLKKDNKHEQQKMEEIEKERLWIEYKLQKQNYNPLYH
jgi:hypothetical protein